MGILSLELMLARWIRPEQSCRTQHFCGGAMDVVVQRTSGTAEHELRSLSQWPSADPEVRRYIQTGLGAAGACHARAPGRRDRHSAARVEQWLQHSLAGGVSDGLARHTAKPPTLVVERPDGVSVEISGQPEAEARALVLRVLGE
ncbi:hypothetical protein [Streptomyces sp. RS2]|uniref:effector-associated constant component EACC1 n=1 Tax=Streptomyces sp. RS2 TaxID=1451205 RepID=UPI0035A88983